MEKEEKANGELRRVWGVYTEDWTSYGITVEKADATFLLRLYEDEEKAKGYAQSISPHAVVLQKMVPAKLACFDKPTWRKAFQYGIPEVWAKFPGVLIKNVTIRHPSGATLQACHAHAVFTFQGKSTLCPSDETIERLLVEYGLPDRAWKVEGWEVNEQ